MANGTGPTVLLTAGNHRDEYEGQVALLDLARTIPTNDRAGLLRLRLRTA
jgi:predicted deacylase